MATYTSTRELKSNRLFTGVNESALASFFDQKEIREVREGEILYKTRDASNSIYLIIKGEVKVKFPSHSYVATKIQHDFFGEKEFIEETKRISSAMAFTKLVYYRIDKDLLKRLIKKNQLIEENLKNFGEFKLPETSSDTDRKFNITDRDKPVSFRVFSNGTREAEERKDEKALPPVLTQQHLPDLESIEMSLEDEELNSLEENFELEEALEKLQEIKTQVPEEIIELPSEEVEPQSAPVQEYTEPTEEFNPIEEQPAELKPREIVRSEVIETGINREIVRRIFFALNKIYSSINISELVKNTKRAIRDLTNSESADLIFIDEKLLTMSRFSS
ncbi:MAG TPA: cyclic nucleotide-binding domain-containing protein, partial [Ignavibacteriaceae bacterium]